MPTFIQRSLSHSVLPTAPSQRNNNESKVQTLLSLHSPPLRALLCMRSAPRPLRSLLSAPSWLRGGRKWRRSQAKGPCQHRAWICFSHLPQKWDEFLILPLCFAVFSQVLTAWVSKGAGERTSKKSSCAGPGEHGERKISTLGFLQLTARARRAGNPLPTQGPRWKKATCLHDAAGGRDVFRDADFIAALKEDGSVVIDIQDGHVHSGSPSAPLPRGAVVCMEEKSRRGLVPSISSLHRWCSAFGY